MFAAAVSRPIGLPNPRRSRPSDFAEGPMGGISRIEPNGGMSPDSSDDDGGADQECWLHDGTSFAPLDRGEESEGEGCSTINVVTI